MFKHRKNGNFFKINGQEVAMFQSVWLKSKLINLIEMHHYATISKMWCEKYIE
jgi:hypothetical protein